ncbi:hypothetical protein BC826DRAFT_1068762, partial [Russula brevipes]
RARLRSIAASISIDCGERHGARARGSYDGSELVQEGSGWVKTTSENKGPCASLGNSREGNGL